jgi:hypothetical protein
LSDGAKLRGNERQFKCSGPLLVPVYYNDDQAAVDVEEPIRNSDAEFPAELSAIVNGKGKNVPLS